MQSQSKNQSILSLLSYDAAKALQRLYLSTGLTEYKDVHRQLIELGLAGIVIQVDFWGENEKLFAEITDLGIEVYREKYE